MMRHLSIAVMLAATFELFVERTGSLSRSHFMKSVWTNMPAQMTDLYAKAA